MKYRHYFLKETDLASLQGLFSISMVYSVPKCYDKNEKRTKNKIRHCEELNDVAFL